MAVGIWGQEFSACKNYSKKRQRQAASGVAKPWEAKAAHMQILLLV